MANNTIYMAFFFTHGIKLSKFEAHTTSKLELYQLKKRKKKRKRKKERKEKRKEKEKGHEAVIYWMNHRIFISKNIIKSQGTFNQSEPCCT